MMKLILTVATVIAIGAIILVIALRDDSTSHGTAKNKDKTELVRQWEKIRDFEEAQPPDEKKPEADESEKKQRTSSARPVFPPIELSPIGFEKYWECHLRDREITGMWLIGGGIYAETKGHWLYKIDAKSGYVLWVYDVEAGIKAAPFVYKYDNSGKSALGKYNELFVLANGTVHCLDEEEGFRLWSHKLRHAPSSPVFASASYFYYGSGDDRLRAVDKESKTITWDLVAGGDIVAGGAQKGPDIFFASEDGRVYCANAALGVIKWTFTAKDAFSAAPCLYKGRLYIGCRDKNLYALHADNGILDWSFTCEAQVVDTPVAVDQTVFCRDKSNSFFAVSRKTGEEKWRLRDGTQLLLLGRKNAYVLTGEKQIAAVENETGKVLWKKPFNDADFFLTNPADSTAVRKGVADYLILCGYMNAWFFCIREKDPN